LPAAVDFCERLNLQIDREDKHTPCKHWHKNPVSTTTQLWGAGFSGSGQLTTAGTYTTFFLMTPMTGWSKVSCGGWHSHAITDAGIMYAAGINTGGELGIGDGVIVGDQIYVLTQVSGTGWADVQGGRWHTIALKTNGTIWGTGFADYGSLGIPLDEIERYVYYFTQAGTDTDWATISTRSGGWSCAALKTNGTLWTWGRNVYGTLGLGDNSIKEIPTQVGSDTWLKVSMGESHCLAIKSNGTLWVTGYNIKGALGLGDFGIGTNRNVFTQVGSDDDWADVYGGEYFSYAIKTNGKIYASGENDDGQLGQGDTLKSTTFIQVGSASWDFLTCGSSGAHVLFVDSNRDLSAVGRNDKGQLGIGTLDNALSIVSVDMQDIVFVSAGISHSVVIKEITTDLASEEPVIWPM